MMNYFSFLTGLIFISTVGIAQPQLSGDYKFKTTSEGCLVLVKQSISLDTLCLTAYKDFSFKRNQVLRVTQNRVIKIEFAVRGTDSFFNNFYVVQEWGVKDNKFLLLNSMKIPLKSCHAKKLKFSLADNGIEWIYRRSFFKREKGVIPFVKLKETDEYDLSCCR